MAASRQRKVRGLDDAAEVQNKKCRVPRHVDVDVAAGASQESSPPATLEPSLAVAVVAPVRRHLAAAGAEANESAVVLLHSQRQRDAGHET